MSREATANISELSSGLVGVPKSGSGETIFVNPNVKLGGVDMNGNRERPSFVGLAHELFHARDANFGRPYPSSDYNNPATNTSYSSAIMSCINQRYQQ